MDVIMQEKEMTLSSCSANADELLNYLMLKGKSHSYYKCYSTIDRVTSIRDDKYLYLGTGARWNDITDRAAFNSIESPKINFGKCFSFSRDECVAMWMLYSGIAKLGGMIDFTQKGMESILSVETIEFGIIEGDEFVYERKLNRDSFDLYCIDMIYYKESEENQYYIKRHNESFDKLPKEILDKLKYCKKAYPWIYENECRLICSVDKRRVSSDCNVARIQLEDLDMGKSLERVYHSPNYPAKNTRNTLPSKLYGSLDWNLCDNSLCERLIIGEEE